MRNRIVLKREKAFIAFSLFLSACSSPARQWEVNSINPAGSPFHVSRIYIAPENPFTGIEVEIRSGGEQVYLNFHSTPLCREAGYTTILLVIGEEKEEVAAECLVGGQRVILPPSQRERMLKALNDGVDIEIAAGKYRQKIPASGFGRHFKASFDCKKN